MRGADQTQLYKSKTQKWRNFNHLEKEGLKTDTPKHNSNLPSFIKFCFWLLCQSEISSDICKQLNFCGKLSQISRASWCLLFVLWASVVVAGNVHHLVVIPRQIEPAVLPLRAQLGHSLVLPHDILALQNCHVFAILSQQQPHLQSILFNNSSINIPKDNRGNEEHFCLVSWQNICNYLWKLAQHKRKRITPAQVVFWSWLNRTDMSGMRNLESPGKYTLKAFSSDVIAFWGSLSLCEKADRKLIIWKCWRK